MSEVFTDTPESARVLGDICDERARQDTTWGVQDHDHPEWALILGEEFGEACQAANACHWGGLSGDANVRHLRDELIQVAAVAVAWVERIDRAARHARP